MTEDDPLIPPARDSAAPVIEHEPAPPPPLPAPPAAVAPPRGGGSNLLTIVLFLLLAGGLAYVWTNPKPAGPDDAVPTLQRQMEAQTQALARAESQAGSQIQALTQQAETLSNRVEKLEKAPAVAPLSGTPQPDLGDLPKRVDDLSAKIDALAARPAAPATASIDAPADNTRADNTAAQQAVAALAQKLDQVQAADKAAIEQLQSAQKDTLDQVQAAAQAQAKAAADRATAAIDQQKTTIDQQAGVLAALDGRIGKIEKGAGTIENAADRASHLNRIQAAIVALQAGDKLGDIPGAPPALTRYASAPPPTEAALRNSFPALAAHAREVSRPDVAHRSFLQRTLARLQESVTVRQGDDVLVGDPAAGVLADAEVRVQNADLAGAVQRLHSLHGPAAQAMANWVDQAQGLVAARAALANLAARG